MDDKKRAPKKVSKMKWQSLADADHPKPDKDATEELRRGLQISPSNEQQPKMRWQSLADAGHPKLAKKNPGATSTTRKSRRSALDRAFSFFDLVMGRTRESCLSSSGNVDEDEGRPRPTMEDMRMPSLTTDEINEMADGFLQSRDNDGEGEETQETRNNSDLLPVANRVSAREVTVVSDDDDEGEDDAVHHGTVVMGFLITDINRNTLRQPIYESVSWLTPLRLLVAGALLLIILVVSLAVALTNTSDAGVFHTISSNPSSSLSPTVTATLRPSASASPTSSPSFLPSARPTERPSVSASPTALPTTTPVTWIQVGTDVVGTTGDEFMGWSVALSANGNELRAAGKGVFRIYILAGTDDWILDEDLSSSLTSWGEVAVSLDGFTVVASDFQHDDQRGRATVYRRVGALWEQLGEPLVGEDGGDWFGHVVTMSSNGTVVVVGAVGGRYVHVYRDDDDEGKTSNLMLLTKIEGEVRSSFGISVAVSADAIRLIVGASGTTIDGRSSVGAAYVYALFPEHTLLQRLDGDEKSGWFGVSVDASSEGDVLAVGSSYKDYVKVYLADDSSLRRYSQLGDRVDGPSGSDFGAALSLSADGTRLAVGAQRDNQNGSYSGRVFVYAVHPRRHETIGEFEGDALGDNFGYSVWLSGDGTRVAVGARGSDVGGRYSGLVRVFESA